MIIEVNEGEERRLLDDVVTDNSENEESVGVGPCSWNRGRA